jgi:hypothetical protein
VAHHCCHKLNEVLALVCLHTAQTIPSRCVR